MGTFLIGGSVEGYNCYGSKSNYQKMQVSLADYFWLKEEKIRQRSRLVKDKPIMLSDSEIIKQVLEGNTNSFESLMLRYKELVLRIVKKHVPYSETEEITQETFIRVYQSLSGFRSRGDFKQWVSSIAVRTCYDYWRKIYRNREIAMSSLTEKQQKWLEEVISDQPDAAAPEEDPQKEATELLDWALERLAPEDRMVVELIYLEGLSGKEAADLLGWSVANVKVRAFRSRNKLKKIFKETVKR
jgi:RNA polymerase sigma-70 factor, ECF subfamily